LTYEEYLLIVDELLIMGYPLDDIPEFQLVMQWENYRRSDNVLDLRGVPLQYHGIYTYIHEMKKIIRKNKKINLAACYIYNIPIL